MNLSPSLLSTAPVLQTVFLTGAPQYCGGQLVFTDDDRYLLSVATGGQLQVWRLPAFQPIPIDCEHHVWKAVWAEHLGGFLVVADGCVMLFCESETGFRRKVIINELPAIEEGDIVDLLAAKSDLVICSSRWVRTYDRETFRLRSHATIQDHAHRVPKVVHIRQTPDKPYIRFVAATYQQPVYNYQYGRINFDGTNMIELSVKASGFQFVESANACLGVVHASSEDALVLVDGESSPLQLLRISSPDPNACLFANGRARFALSENGNAFSLVTDRCITSWASGRVVGFVKCDRTWYNARISNDGTHALITYCSGIDSPNMAGVIDLSKGVVVGQCKGHMIGVGPHAFSKSNKYCATVITDDVADCHPDNLPSGTIVLTKLPD